MSVVRPPSSAPHLQGALNGVTGGMLLYMTLIVLMAEEFSRSCLRGRPGLKAGMYLSLCAGAALMAVVGLWA